ARTVSWTRCGFTSAPKMAASSVTSFDFTPSAFRKGALGAATALVLSDLDDAVLGAGDGALDQQQVPFCVDLVDGQADLGAALRAHVPGHAHALHHPRRRR